MERCTQVNTTELVHKSLKIVVEDDRKEALISLGSGSVRSLLIYIASCSA